MEEIVQNLIIWAPWETRPFVTLDESEVYLFISHIPQISELRLKPTNKQRDKTIQNQKFLLDPITPAYVKCFFYRSRGKLIIHDKTVARTFDLRNAVQKGSPHLPLPWRVSGLFTVPFFFTKIVKIENLPLRAAILVSNVPRKRVPVLVVLGKGGENFSRLQNRPLTRLVYLILIRPG